VGLLFEELSSCSPCLGTERSHPGPQLRCRSGVARLKALGDVGCDRVWVINVATSYLYSIEIIELKNV